ncbi:MAG: hypothetical protein ACYSTZ_05590 [Planctomycetota bacterium]|jgi:hypothetical protein
MRKFLNVSLLLLVVGFSGSLAGCGGWMGPDEPTAAEPGLSAGDYLERRTTGSSTVPAVRTTPATTTARTTPLIN